MAEVALKEEDEEILAEIFKTGKNEEIFLRWLANASPFCLYNPAPARPKEKK